MANTLTTLIPRVLARSLRVLRERSVMPRLVNSDYNVEAKKKGATVDIPTSVRVNVTDVTPSNTQPAPVNTTPGQVQLTLDKWRKNEPFHLTHDDLNKIEASKDFLPMQIDEAIRSLANDANANILSRYTGVYGYVGTAGTTPFASTVTAATDARKVLNQQLCPLAPRRGVVDFNAEANMLALAAFADAEKTMSAQVKIEGEIGRKYGIDWVAEDAVPYHTAGTAAAATVTMISNSAADATTVTLKVSAATATLVVGDIISFAGHDQTYTVTAPATLDTTGVAVSISPGLAVDVDGSVTPVEVTVRESHRVNLVFHREAFAFAQRTLASDVPGYSPMNPNMFVMQDPQTGIILRLEVMQQYKQIAWEFDILYGSKLVRPELAVRIAG